jgi:putative mRNA 3-end processing factor
MRVKQRAKQRGVELPLVIPDHAAWDELLATMREIGAPEVWITYGREEALMHAAAKLRIIRSAMANLTACRRAAPGLRLCAAMGWV